MDTNHNSSYYWHGTTFKGDSVSGYLKSPNLFHARTMLIKKGIKPHYIIQCNLFFSLILRIKLRISTKEITAFGLQILTLLKAGIPLVQALKILSKNIRTYALANLATNLKNLLEEGHSFSDALAKYPQYFNHFYCNFVHIGEQSGTLEAMLERLLLHKQKILQLRSKIKKALFYPTFILITAILVTWTVLTFVVPQFESLFINFGAELPALTLSILQFSKILQGYSHFIITSFIFFIAIFYGSYKNINNFNLIVDKLLLKSPFLGSILKNATIALFTRTLATIFKAGIPIMEGLTATVDITPNKFFNSTLGTLQTEIRQGQTLHETMQKNALFPEMLIQMIAIGENSGSLTEILTKMAEHYEGVLDNQLNTVSQIIEPIMMLILGLLIGLLMIALYLPLFQLGSIL